MLAKNYRMKKNSQFDYIFKNGKVLKNSKLLVFYSSSKSKNPKVGIVVSKKIGNSVTRNHVKRLLRESIKSYIQNLKTSYNYIFVARPGIETISLQEINNIISKLIEKTDLYVQKSWIIFYKALPADCF